MNDRAALRAAVDAFIGALPKADRDRAKLKALVDWLHNQPCVASAELEQDLLASDPPIQVVHITLQGGERLSFGIRIARDRLYFDHR